MNNRWSTADLVAATVITALAARVVYLFVRYMAGSPGAERFRVETWASIFLVAGLVLRTLRSRASEAGTPVTPYPIWAWPAFCGLALALYRPALGVGYLSDDYVLVARASDWRIGPVTPALFRPLPLFLWALLLQVGGAAPLLHLVNILLHGTNAYLTVGLVMGWVRDRVWSLMAGLLVVTSPLAPEAVVWLSGVFDVLATTLVLSCLLIARRYRDQTPATTRLQFAIVAVAAVASKETAAIAGALVLLDAWARGVTPRQLRVDAALLIVAAGAFSLVRLVSAFGVTAPTVSKYVVQRAVFGTFGSFAVPWHVEVSRNLPAVAIFGVAAVLYLATAFFLYRGSSMRTTRVLASMAWVLLAILPVLPILFIAPDLQQSRYLYLSAIGWAMLVVLLASEPRGAMLKAVSLAVVCGLIVTGSYGAVRHVQPWMEAARLRDRVEALALDSRMGECRTAVVGGLPDSVKGAYVFRNGGAEAFARDLNLNITVEDEPAGECAFRWSDARSMFVRAGAQ